MVDGIATIPIPGQPLLFNTDCERGQASRLALGHFFVGPENRLAGTALRAVVDGPNRGFDPVVFFGPSGTGKSHLARGLVTEWRARYRRRRVEYTTAVDFARQLADAMETQAMDDLRTQYRKAALVVFEDVGQLADRHGPQNELVHMLDALLSTGRRVVITCAAPVSELPGILPTLQSRLAGGLTVPLALPGPDTRMAILQHLAKLRNVDLSRQVSRILAGGLNVTVPELLGALVQLEMQARLSYGGIEPEAARQYVAERNGSRRPPLRDVALATAKHFSLKLSDLRSASQRRAVVSARNVAMYLARRLTGKSLEQIGRYFGGRDHTTVMYGCRKTEGLLQSDPHTRQAVELLQRNWRST